MKNYLTASVSASAVRHNIGVLRGLVAPGVKICLVVKDNCYGHGLDVLYPVLSEKLDGFAVASPVEALELRGKGYDGFILCFLSAYFDDFDIQDELVEKGITQTVMSASALESIQAAAKRTGKTAQVHLKVDTGMGRLGVPANQATKLLEAATAAEGVEPIGIYTHFATAGEEDKTAAFQQLELFNNVLLEAERRPRPFGATSGTLVRHAANSAATIDLPQTHFDMVRPGIAIYGCHPSADVSRIGLKPCMEVSAKLIATKHIRKGGRSGYGLTYEYTRDSRVGIVPVGYGDGYLRSFSNSAVVRIGKAEALVCGRVSMDQITVDLTDIPDARVGDKVEVVSADPAAPNSVENLARLAGTIPYEITCGLGSYIHHVLVD
ncbi:MAG: alanine racemase [Kiritimatiellales bacterium]|nr:alanine racemase [Kiritimatiellales bacterium]